MPKPGVAPKKLELVSCPVLFLIECPTPSCPLRRFLRAFFSLIHLRVHAYISDEPRFKG